MLKDHSRLPTRLSHFPLLKFPLYGEEFPASEHRAALLSCTWQQAGIAVALALLLPLFCFAVVPCLVESAVCHRTMFFMHRGGRKERWEILLCTEDKAIAM